MIPWAGATFRELAAKGKAGCESGLRIALCDVTPESRAEWRGVTALSGVKSTVPVPVGAECSHLDVGLVNKYPTILECLLETYYME